MNRNDRTVLVAALTLAVLMLTGIFLLGTPSQISPKGEEQRGSYVSYAVPVSQQKEEFYFDPNTADSTQFLRLGLQPWQVRNIYRYRAKGGIYRRKEDFARLYGLTVKDYRRLEPYIRISADYQPAASLFASRRGMRNEEGGMRNEEGGMRNEEGGMSNEEGGMRNEEGGMRNEEGGMRNVQERRFPVKIKSGEHVVLNTADTAMLRRVPGIGIYYAKEIDRYGRRLGGYVNVDQLDEIDRFPQSAKKYFVIDHATPHKLNVNHLSLEQLRRHPYINYYQAKAITTYRRLRGPIKSIQDLRLSSDFTEADLRRLEPYVEF